MRMVRRVNTRLAVDRGSGSAIYQWPAFVPQFRFGTKYRRVPAARCRSAFARRVIIESGSPPGFAVLRGRVRRRVARTRTAPSARAVVAVHPRRRGKRWWGAPITTTPSTTVAAAAAAAAAEGGAASSPTRRRRATMTGCAAFFVSTSVSPSERLPNKNKIWNFKKFSYSNKYVW